LSRKRSDILVEVYRRKILWLSDSIRITSYHRCRLIEERGEERTGTVIHDGGI
jgi:hypothetical protein